MKRFRLCGYINLFGIIPDFVYPVYYQMENIFLLMEISFLYKISLGLKEII